MEAGSIRSNYPFVPYPGQLDLSKSLYDVLTKGQVGIFESPTGTGKSMAMLIGALTWMEDHKEDFELKFDLANTNNNSQNETSKPTADAEDSFPDWFDEGKMLKNQFITSEQKRHRS